MAELGPPHGVTQPVRANAVRDVEQRRLEVRRHAASLRLDLEHSFESAVVVRTRTLLWSSSAISDISPWRDTKVKTSE
jgi:hypothetical protein